MNAQFREHWSSGNYWAHASFTVSWEFHPWARPPDPPASGAGGSLTSCSSGKEGALGFLTITSFHEVNTLTKADFRLPR